LRPMRRSRPCGDKGAIEMSGDGAIEMSGERQEFS